MRGVQHEEALAAHPFAQTVYRCFASALAGLCADRNRYLTESCFCNGQCRVDGGQFSGGAPHYFGEGEGRL